MFALVKPDVEKRADECAVIRYKCGRRGRECSTVYVVRAGVGTVITALLGVWLFREALTPAVAIGILLIIGGVIVLNTATIAR